MTQPVMALAVAFPHGHRIPRHRHRSAQLIHAVTGVMTVTTRDGTWVVPGLRAVFVPPGVAHTIRMTGDVAMRTVYIARPLADTLPRSCCVVSVTPLLREAIVRATSFPKRRVADAREARIAALIVDEICAARVAPLQLPAPRDPRALRVTRALQADPGDARSLARWAKQAGASSRTLARLFQRETGLSFRAWRQQLRLLRALERIANGDAITTIALELGYESPSAFIAMFRKALGASPSRYFQSH